MRGFYPFAAKQSAYFTVTADRALTLQRQRAYHRQYISFGLISLFNGISVFVGY